MYQYIFFDLDGTLTDPKEGMLRALRHAIQTLGDPIPSDDTLLRFIGPPIQEGLMTILGWNEEKAAQGTALFRAEYTRQGRFENLAAPGMPELCARLKKRGYALAVASSKLEWMCEDICTRYGFFESMDVIAGAEEGKHLEKADVIRKAMERFGLTEADRKKILMVGDRKYDAIGAAKFGIGCVGVDFFGYAEPGELEAAGMLAVVNSAEELEQFLTP